LQPMASESTTRTGSDMHLGVSGVGLGVGGGEGYSTTASASRYRTDFEEIEAIGHGGFGEVVKVSTGGEGQRKRRYRERETYLVIIRLVFREQFSFSDLLTYVQVRNRLDGRYYAVKKVFSRLKIGYCFDFKTSLIFKVLLDSWDQRANGKILREVTTLSRLHHMYVVRYFQAWIEGTDVDEIEALLARAQEQDPEQTGDHSTQDDDDNDDDDNDDDNDDDDDDGHDDNDAPADRGGPDSDDDVQFGDDKTAKEGHSGVDWRSTRSIVFDKGSDSEQGHEMALRNSAKKVTAHWKRGAFFAHWSCNTAPCKRMGIVVRFWPINTP
jgi:translation initiation factor 2-alpha kinase 4